MGIALPVVDKASQGFGTKIKNSIAEQNAPYTEQGLINPDTVYQGMGPRIAASDMILGMSKDFWNEQDPYSGISLKKDLERMTTYNGNPGVLGQLNQESAAANNSAFRNAQGLQGRTLQRYGMQQTAEQAQQSQSDMTRNKVLGSVDAQNRNQQFQNDLNKKLVSGNTAPTLTAATR